MKSKYFESTDTLYIELCQAPVDETRDLYENTLLDLGGGGRLCAITIEQARERMSVPEFSFPQAPA